MKSSTVVPQKIIGGSSNSTSGCFDIRDLNRYLYNNVHSSVIHNCKRVEMTQMFINGLTGKQNVVYKYNGILFSLKKEGNFDTCYNMYES